MRLSLSTKILAIVLTAGAAVVAVNFGTFLNGYKRDAMEDMVEKAGAFTAVADEAKNHQSMMLGIGAVDTKTLVEEASAAVKRGEGYEKTRFYSAIPVVVGWTAAGKAAEREGLTFKVPAFDARNSKNTPPAGSFREALLKDLTAQFKSEGKETISRVDTATDTLHYMRAIKLDASCMTCHGDPNTMSVKDDKGLATGKDPLGFRMEGWKEGDMHGAYEVQLPLKQMEQQVAGFVWTGLAFTAPLALGACGGLVFFMRRLIGKPLSELVNVFNKVANGDLTAKANIRRTNDEVGDLANAVEVSTGKFRDMIVDVNKVTTEVAQSASQVAASSEEMAATMTKQQQQSSEVASAVTEMSASASEVAQKASEAAGAASESKTQASEGGAVVGQTVSEMKAIAAGVSESARSVADLGKRSDQIGQIVGVINDIADQTNLLALNAAIEAARAGEHGRGFAVVADEVRKLAERTTKATDEVATSIRQIQEETKRAVNLIENGSQRVTHGVELANSAGDALSKITGRSDEMAGMIQAIAAAAEEQSAASEQVAKSISQISEATRESSAGASQAAEAAEAMAGQVRTLTDLVSRFKV